MAPSTSGSQQHLDDAATSSELRQDQHATNNTHPGFNEALAAGQNLNGSAKAPTRTKPPISPPSSTPRPSANRNTDRVGDDNGNDDEPSSSNGVVSPVYWNHAPAHERTTSLTSNPSHGITLEDHTLSPTDSSTALWARSLTIDSHLIIRGNLPSLTGINLTNFAGAYVVWLIKVDILDSPSSHPIFIRKRYSDFENLRADLIAAFPRAKKALPQLPPKDYLRRFQEEFLDKRRKGLEAFLECVLLNPEFAGSPVVKDFIFE